MYVFLRKIFLICVACAIYILYLSGTLPELDDGVLYQQLTVIGAGVFKVVLLFTVHALSHHELMMDCIGQSHY